MRCLVTGAKGMLGVEIAKEFKLDGQKDNLYLTDKDTLDVTDRNGVFSYAKYLPKLDCILHLAAETDLEWCEASPAYAYYVNTFGTLHMAELAMTLDIPIVYMSTAGIFSGDDSIYQERSAANPKNHYGMSKLRGEHFVTPCEKHYIFRMSWAIGGGPEIDKKFVNKVVKKIYSGEKAIYGITDIYGSPTWTRDVARTIHGCLLSKIPYGIYHTAGIGSASRYDVAKEIVSILKLNVEVVPVTAAEFGRLNANFPCPRACNETIVSTKTFPSAMRPWRDSLEEYLMSEFA